MKNAILLSLLFLFALSACTPNEPTTEEPVLVIEEEIDYEKEKEAIMALLQEESAAFWDKDYERYAACWAHEEYIRTMGWWDAGGVTVVEGWEERSKRTKNHMETSPEANPTATQVIRENINLRIHKDIAWMTFDQYGEDTGDDLMDMPGLSRETRIFEKIDGKWKIVYLGWLLDGRSNAEEENAAE